MPLILTSQIQSIPAKDEKASSQFIQIPRHVFSQAYSIPNGSTVYAYIENIGLWDSYVRQTATSIQYDDDFSDLLDKIKQIKISFKYARGKIGSYDLLFFEDESWNIIRDYGVLPDYNFVRVNIFETSNPKNGSSAIFPHRDVRIVVD